MNEENEQGEPTSYKSDERLERARHLIDLGRPGKAIPLATDVLREEPEDAEALGVLTCAYLCSGQYQEAISWSEKATAANPFDEYPHRLRAFALLATGKKKAALEAAYEAVRLDTEGSGALWALFRALYQSRKWKEALEIAEILTELYPEDEDSHQARSEALCGLRRWEQAEQAARDGLGIRPDKPDLHIGLARALWAQKRRVESLLAYREAVLADPGDSEAADALSEQVGRYIIPLERAIPWYLWMCLASVLCWYAHRILGWWTWWGLLWAVILLVWNTLYVCNNDLWIIRYTRQRYAEIPPEVQRHLWLANAFHPSVPLLVSVLGLALVTVVLLIVWTFVPAWSPAPLEGWGVGAFLYLAGLWISAFTGLIRLGNVEESINRLKPEELKEPTAAAEQTEVAVSADWVRHTRPANTAYDLFDTPGYDLDE